MDRSIWGSDRSYWIRFDEVQNLKFQGGGTFDGNGGVWWRNSCKINKSQPCKKAPTVWFVV
ncbi:hypothetical protein QJS10_CPA06g01818 [Acorus calamus]|uniref:Uncharacterized protein n=1 Tax=Acorus calamus TaxID=4465 RepID=A0AAV9EN57_ACOCL|nr:hypothetical protein QJS10_CPA06g01818 [Acorus calamus]